MFVHRVSLSLQVFSLQFQKDKPRCPVHGPQQNNIQKTCVLAGKRENPDGSLEVEQEGQLNQHADATIHLGSHTHIEQLYIQVGFSQSAVASM